jgi:hypothetical protein
MKLDLLSTGYYWRRIKLAQFVAYIENALASSAGI